MQHSDMMNLTIAQKIAVASNIDTPPGILIELANDQVQGLPGAFDETYALKRDVADNPSAPLDLLQQLADDDEIEVRWAVAKNPSITLDMIERFSQTHDLVEAVALNPNCPGNILEVIAKVKDDSVRAAVASNANLPKALIQKWAKSKSEWLRESLASNPSLSIENFDSLVSDEEVNVRIMLAANPACPEDVLERLSHDEEADVRSAVASSPLCSPKLVEALESDSEVSVIKALAGNAQTPLACLARFATHENGEVRIAVAENPVCPDGIKTLALTIPACSLPSNVDINQIMRPVSELRNLLIEARSEDPDNQFLKHPGVQDIEFCSPAWYIKTFDIPTEYADRTRSMLEGPFFTSENYPWPMTDDDLYASPLVQVDLREVSQLKGNDYGDGLLQVFAIDTDFVIRVIPRSEVDLNLMTEGLPKEEAELSGEFTHKYWLADGAFVSQIIGYEEPVLSCNVYCSDGIPKPSDPEIFTEIFSRMEQIEDLNCSGVHMFGTFYPIQYRHSEVKGEVLMTLDDESCFSWHDSGNAQIFVVNNNNGPAQFIAQWSCY